ncbi:GntR family transcriptional regulator [Falsirhodobacter xinxiangensis]|uniref:GntR family transcriptional regulator n=1 Tax=Falsirhodobacter xinxiangensis TaxID=2530049 RepID=UPI0010AAE4CF|nr:GntR family transcriptional regulator [Rhodobacter xinxiangensis]
MTATERVYAHIRDQILAGTLRPGARLGEAGIAADLGVSRTPVREALRKLSADGYTDLRPHAGAAVRLWDPAEVRSSFAIRADIEGQAAARTAQTITTGQLAGLEQLCARMEAPGAVAQRSELNRELHQTILRISGLVHAERIAMQLADIALLTLTFHSFSNAQAERSDSDHRMLLMAFRIRDADYAQAVMRTHILTAAAVLDDVSRSRG